MDRRTQALAAADNYQVALNDAIKDPTSDQNRIASLAQSYRAALADAQQASAVADREAKQLLDAEKLAQASARTDLDRRRLLDTQARTQAIIDQNAARLPEIQARTDWLQAQTALAQVRADDAPGQAAATVALKAAQTNLDNARTATVQVDSTTRQQLATTAQQRADTGDRNADTAAQRAADQAGHLANLDANTAALLPDRQAYLQSQAAKNTAAANQAGAKADYIDVQAQQLQAGALPTFIDQLKAAIGNQTMTPQVANDALSERLGYGTPMTRQQDWAARQGSLYSDLLRAGVLVPSGWQPDNSALNTAMKHLGLPSTSPPSGGPDFGAYAKSVIPQMPTMQGGFDAQGNLTGYAASLNGAMGGAPPGPDLTGMSVEQIQRQHPELFAPPRREPTVTAPPTVASPVPSAAGSVPGEMRPTTGVPTGQAALNPSPGALPVAAMPPRVNVAAISPPPG